MKRIPILLIAIFMTMGAMAQQDPHYTMYMFNKQTLNPAYVGSRGVPTIQALYRNQWVGIDGNPVTINAGFHTPLNIGKRSEPRTGVGIMAFNDKLGVSNTFGMYLQYSYKIPLNTDENTFLSFGLQGGFDHFRGNLNDLFARDNDDIVLTENISSFLPNLGAGLYLYSDRYYVGLSVPHLIQNKYDPNAVETSGDMIARQYRHYFGMTGVMVPISDAVKMKPNVMVKYLRYKNVEIPFDADFNLSFIFYDRLSLGASYRLHDSFDALLELQVTRNLRMGYAYDYTLSELQASAAGSHEIMIGWDFGQKVKTFTTPRFIRYF